MPRFSASVQWLAVPALALLGISASAQEPPLFFQHLTTTGGLSSNNVWALCKDADGYLWAGTENGLNRFDGIACKAYYHQQGNARSISGANVHQLLPDTGGRIWAGTQTGLSCYSRNGDDFSNYYFPAAGHRQGTRPQYVFPFFADDTGWLWLYLGGKGAVCRYRPATGQLDSVSNISNGYVFTGQPMHTPLRGYATRGQNGIYALSLAYGRAQQAKGFFSGDRHNGEPTTFIDQAYLESDTLWWLCADAGLIALNPQSGQYQVYNNYAGQAIDANCIATINARSFSLALPAQGCWF